MGRTTSVLRRTAAALLLAAAAVAFAGTAGCGVIGNAARDIVPPTTPAGITGVIKMVEPSTQAGVVCTILVEGGQQPPGAVSDKASIAVTDDTTVAKEGRRMEPDDLAAGMSVRVWFDGPVAESYPVQGRSGFIEIQ